MRLVGLELNSRDLHWIRYDPVIPMKRLSFLLLPSAGAFAV